MSCINKNSKLITNISDKLGLKPIVVSSQLAVFSEKNNISLDDKDIESKFVEYLSTSDKHKHLNIRELNTDNKSTINVEGDVKQSIINSIKNAKESEDKVYISNDVLDKLQDSKDVLNEINDTIGIPDNVILPYSVEMRPITTSKILSKLKSKQDIYIKFTPEERKRRVDLLANLFVERVSQLNEAQPNKSRIDIIQEYNPSEIFNDIKNEFKGLLDSDIDQSIKDKVSKIIDHFSDLSKLSANKIGWEENIKLSTVDTTDSYNKYNNPDDLDNKDDLFKEEEEKDRWMTNYMESSNLSSLSTLTRKVLGRIPMLDYKGQISTDDLGFPVYMDADYAHAELIEGLKNMTSGTDLVPMLKDLSISKKWIQGVVDKLDSTNGVDEKNSKEIARTKALFYKDFRKDAANFYIQKKQIAPDGTVKIQTISLNAPKGILYLINKWRDNLDNDITLTKSSIYNKDGLFNKDNIQKNSNIVTELKKDITTINNSNKSFEEKVSGIQDLTNRNNDKVFDLLRSVGVDVTSDEVNKITSFRPSELSYPSYENILNTLQTILSVASKQSDRERVDKLHLLNSQYKSMANLIAPFVDEYFESSVHQGNKMLYSHLVPNYFGKLTKLLRNAKADSIEKYIDWVKQEYGKAQLFFKNGYRNEWLRLLTLKDEVGNDLGEKYRNMLDDSLLLSSNNIDYTDLDSVGYTSALIHEFFSDPNNKTAKYHIPIMADAPIARFIKFVRYTNGSDMDENYKSLDYEDTIVNKLLQVAHQEIDRINLVNVRKTMPNIAKIKNFDANGDKFQFLKFLNEDLDTIQEMYKDKKEQAEIDLFIKNKIENGLDEAFTSAVNKWNKSGLFNMDEKGNFTELDTKALRSKDINTLTNTDSTKIGDRRSNNNNPLKEYFFNTYFAESQIIQLLTNDLAQYKDTIDFQKRSKEWNAPGLKLDTTIDGGRQFEHTVYLRDSEVTSSKETLDNLKTALDTIVKKGNLNTFERDTILAKYGAYNAKIFTLNEDKYKEVVSNDSITKGYTKNGVKISKDNYNNALNQYGREPTPVLYRDNKGFIPSSTINLTDAQAYRSWDSYKAVLNMAGKLTTAIEESMNRIKTGNWNLNDFNTVLNAFKPFLFTNTMINSHVNDENGSPIYLRQANQNKNSEFMLLLQGVITNSPKLSALEEFMSKEHTFSDGSKGNIDVVQFNSAVKVGEQGVLDINNLNNKEDVSDYLNQAVKYPDIVHTFDYDDYGLQQEIPEHYQDTQQLFGTQIRKLIHSDLDSNIKISLTINGKDKTLSKKEWMSWYNHAIVENVIKSFDDTQKVIGNKYELERLLKDEITSKNNYNQDLVDAVTLNANGEFNIPLFEPSQSLKIQNLLNSVIKNRITKQKIKGGSLVQVSAFGLQDDLHIVYEGEDSNKHIKHYECYMPWYSKQYVEQLIGDNGELDINKFPEELKSLVGYRIPTEDAYSMMPLYIKGFLPQNSGSAIMLPAEITTIAGCDFDIDKLYFIAPEFTINNNKISKIQVDVNTPEELKNCSVEQRNNLLLDMLTSILQHPDTIAKSMNPGGFDKWIDAMNKYKSEKSSFNSLDPTTQVELHQQNMGAKKLIGIFANHNVNHSLLQNTDTHINDDFKFTYNNKVFTQLNQIKSKEGHYISRTLAGLVASSVDAIKQPVLGTLNINTFTADTACLLARLGYNEFEVAALLVHPAIKEVVDRYMKIQNTAPIKANIIKDVIDDYSKLLSTPQSNDIKDKPFLVEELDRDTKLGLTLQDFKDNKEDSQELIKHHIEVLSLYDKISTIAEDLSDVVSILKSDTSNGGAGPSIADNINKLDKIIDFSLSRETPDAKIIGLEPFVNGILDVYNNDYTQTDLMDYDKMREHIYKNSLAYPLAFNLYGVQSTIPLFFKYFPQYSDNFRNLVRSFKDLTKSEKINVKTMNDIYNDYFSYIASSINSFGGEANEILNKNNYYINEFPKEFKSLLESKKYADNSFISKLAVSKIKGTEIEKIWFNNVGKLTPSTRESVMDGWNSLLYGNEEDKKLAKNLFFYNFHRNGFAFSPETFIHLAPVELKMQIEGYIDTMNSLLRNPNFENIHFVNQYLLNNLDNRKFTPLLDDIEEKNIQNTISFKYDSTNYDSNVSKITKLNNQGDIQWNTTLGIKDKEGKINYYIKNTESSTDNIKEATYSKIDSLGMKNEFQEYSYNTAIEDFKSVIDGSKQEDTFKNPDEESYYNDEDSMENTHQDDIMSSYDSNSLGVDNKEDFFETNNKAVDPDSGEKLC